MPADDERGIEVGGCHPVDAPLVRLELALFERQSEEAVGVAAMRIHQRSRFVGQPSVVVVDRRTHHPFPWLGAGDPGVSPVCRHLSDEPGMIGLADDERFAARFATHGVPYDHAASLSKPEPSMPAFPNLFRAARSRLRRSLPNRILMGSMHTRLEARRRPRAAGRVLRRACARRRGADRHRRLFAQRCRQPRPHRAQFSTRGGRREPPASITRRRARSRRAHRAAAPALGPLRLSPAHRRALGASSRRSMRMRRAR